MSNVINYVQHSRFHSLNHTLDIKAVNKYKHKHSTDDREFKELDFGITPQKLWEEYMDIYEGIQSEIVSSNRFDENSDLSTAYLGRVDKGNENKLKQRSHSQHQNMGILQIDLLDGIECQLLLDIGASKSFYVKDILHVMQITPFFTKICVKDTKNTSRK